MSIGTREDLDPSEIEQAFALLGLSTPEDRERFEALRRMGSLRPPKEPDPVERREIHNTLEARREPCPIGPES
jgi:hypothetical protein